ncbi:MAG: helicase-related protein [Candidatus Aenigmatarchaeota archaeon]
MSDDYFEHPLLKDGELQKRLYQETIFHTTMDNNTLVVLPTGMGKTVSALLLAAHRLNEKGGKVLLLAPTRPLVEQHKRFFNDFLEIAEDDLKVLTGKVRPEKREKEYGKGMCFFATPQVVQNDIIAGRMDLSKFTLVIFDECQHATGDYPYSFIAEMYMKRGEDPRILGITASPGGSEEEIRKVMDNLYLDEVEIRTESDKDVNPYVEKVAKEWKKVELPEEFKKVKKLLEEAYKKRIKKLKEWDYAPTGDVYRKELLKLQGRLRKKISQGKEDKMLYAALSKSAEALKIEHGLMLLETQGSSSLYQYFKRLREEAREGKTKAAKAVMKDGKIATSFRKTSSLLEKGIEHPKLDALREVVEEQLEEKEDSKILVFSHYRDQVDKIREELEELEGCEPGQFVGQAGDEGMSQTEQVERLEKLEEGEYNTLIATSVGEEGLDIPAVDLVVFYEPVASEIRAIQRRGRTGRQRSGKVIVLMAKDTRDEAYYWKSKHRERRMKETLKDMKSNSERGQKDLENF